jgi:hypothetical protein
MDDVDDVPYCLSTYTGKQPSLEDQWLEVRGRDERGIMGHSAHSPIHNVQDIWASRGCEAKVEGAIVPLPFDTATQDLITQCLTPDRSSPDLPAKTMFLLGDCHSAVILPGLVLAVRGAYQVRHVYSNNCGLFPHRDPSGATWFTNYERYVDVYSRILQTLREQMRSGDAVVISMHGANWLGHTGTVGRSANGTIIDLPDTTPFDMMERDLLQGVVQKAKGELIILGDWPYFENANHGTPDRKEAKVNQHAQVQEQLGPYIKRNKALRYESLVPAFCDAGTVLDNKWTMTPKGACSWNIPGSSIAAYADDNHLRTVGSIYMWPYLCDILVDHKPAAWWGPDLRNSTGPHTLHGDPSMRGSHEHDRSGSHSPG